MNNWNLIGHDWAANLLQRHLRDGQARHAYLFCGPQGVGRSALALRFAMAINCQQPPEQGLYCGECRSCRLISAMQHPDLTVLDVPPERTMIPMDAVLELQRSMALTPYEAKYRVGLLLNFDAASESAENALLKTLEEAPPRVILLLTASSPENLLPTIASRCEVLLLRPLPPHILQEHLQAGGLSQPDAHLLAHISGGRPGLALSLKDDPDRLAQRHTAIDDLMNLMSNNRRERISYAESEARGKDRAAVRESLKQLLLTWSSFWRDVMLACAGGKDGLPLTNVDVEDAVRMVAEHVSLSEARRQVGDMERAIARLDKINLQLQLESLVLNLPVMASSLDPN